MIAYETATKIEMVERINFYQNLHGDYEIDFNKEPYKIYKTKEECKEAFDELRKLFYNKELKIIKG